MSHVTTSAVVATTGLGRLETLPGTQLASNERFRDFLESYVHPETPVHAALNQKNSTDRTDTTKRASSLSGEKVQENLSETRSGTEAAVKRRQVSETDKQPTPVKQITVPHSSGATSTPQKNAVASSKEPTQKTSGNTQQTAAQTTSAKAGDKSSVDEKQAREENAPALEVGVDNERTVPDTSPENATTVVLSGSGPEESDQKDSPSAESTIQSVSETSGAESSRLKEAQGATDWQGIPAEKGNSVTGASVSIENTATIHMESASTEKVSTDSVEETSHASQTENTQAAVDDDEQVARHGNQQPLLYQKNSNGSTTTHIEMNVGTHEKVHVEIGQTTTKEQRIHINTDNPEVYQSLKNDHDTLLASLTETATPAVISQDFIPADIQISFSQSSFSDMSSRDEQQESNSQPSGASRAGSSAKEASVAERRFLRGVVDLTA